jgi:hypothetical protein
LGDFFTGASGHPVPCLHVVDKNERWDDRNEAKSCCQRFLANVLKHGWIEISFSIRNFLHMYISSYLGATFLILDTFLRLLNLQLQRLRCDRLGHFFILNENIIVFMTLDTTRGVVSFSALALYPTRDRRIGSRCKSLSRIYFYCPWSYIQRLGLGLARWYENLYLGVVFLCRKKLRTN